MGNLKVTFKQYEEDILIRAGSFTVSCTSVKEFENAVDQIDKFIMDYCHSMAVEFTHTFTF